MRKHLGILAVSAALLGSSLAAAPAIAAPAAPAVAAPAPAIRTDVVITSFDGTPIHTNFFPATGLASGQQAPTVMVGPGFGLPGGRIPLSTTSTLIGSIGIAPLRDAGYNVVTWDPRGFGLSGGEAYVNNPAYEGRDGSAIIDYIAAQPEAQLESPGDPVLGMAGASYGGGIQFVLASQDQRVDAITPTIAWNDLTTSLYKAGSFKTGWGALLCAEGTALGQLGSLVGNQGALSAPVRKACQEGLTYPNQLSAESIAYFESLTPDTLFTSITAPTLIIQGTADTLFTLDEARRNYDLIRSTGTPTKMLQFCGGHGLCNSTAGPDRITPAVLNWFARYLRNEPVDTGAAFQFIDQAGVTRGAPGYPQATGALTGTGKGSIILSPAAISGAVVAAAVAPVAVNVPISAPTVTTSVFGAPQLTLTYRGSARQVNTHVYAQIIDRSRSSLVLGNQVTPVPLILDGKEHTLTIPLEEVSYTADPSTRLVLQVTPATSVYALPKATALTSFTASVTVPTVAAYPAIP
ncbi:MULTISPECIES: S9 family peptidase [unclassified Arthrobacter]|uniref:alpha/beta hydrolase family protein n=1 Tax=unclassified Arthrobacter TaxID=235627 RepID=UPI002101F368|nr:MULTISPECIES: CocE/NonD family hydrolase [unclassified Arthrobacter]MCQ1947492.1 CocE/NonD family hydrolase [Arthrobacter sp. zg-Y1116]MCQ1987444.1 CocE/NonD family hydrolase [Arthrobacter sp. zg-Y844]MCQ1996788.1 CocE/NonD family hydrolase [Arthrobacter sp. zg-Y1171]UWX82382.1 CocE/NonD family hydrolase [Arthrobacter sp. zg-Y1171]